MNIKTGKSPLLRTRQKQELASVNALAERVLELERAVRQLYQSAGGDIIEIDRRLTAGGL